MQLTLLPDPAASARYLARYACHACARIDTAGSEGPAILYGEPGAYTSTSGRWFCRACSAVVWAHHLANAGRLVARRERLELYKARRLPWQEPRPSWWPDGLPNTQKEIA